ncbi:MAG: hypothetical protein KatS3mg054_1080 [Chloroflexus sp.]|nr:MAG: hypothetical protein KatS3mg054_1080 [Chloroflexus sp.]
MQGRSVSLWVSIAGVLCLLGCIWFTIVQPLIIGRDLQKRWLDRKYMHIVCYVAKSIYDRTGLLLETSYAVEASPFFPFEPLLAPCSGNEPLFSVDIDSVRVRWTAVMERGGNRREVAKQWSVFLPPSEQTRRQLAALIRGPKWWISEIKSVRVMTDQRFSINIMRRQWERECTAPLRVKPLPTDLRVTHPAEVRNYEKWLQQLLGEAVLYDVWGYRIRLGITGGRMWALSVGADGLAGTSDDIRLEHPLN